MAITNAQIVINNGAVQTVVRPTIPVVTLSSNAYNSSGVLYTLVENSGTLLPQRSTINIFNGLTAVDNPGATRTDIGLGGVLASNVTIDQNNNSLTLQSNSGGTAYQQLLIGFGLAQLFSQNGANSNFHGSITVSGTNVGIDSRNGVSGDRISFNVDAAAATALFTDLRAAKKGIEYNATGYVTQLHSLADKEYVDNNTVPPSRTLTINGTPFDLSANRAWTISAGGTNSASNLELMMSDGTNAVHSNIFNSGSSAADLILGGGSTTGTTRTISSAGSSSNIDIKITPKGTGDLVLNNGKLRVLGSSITIEGATALLTSSASGGALNFDSGWGSASGINLGISSSVNTTRDIYAIGSQPTISINFMAKGSSGIFQFDNTGRQPVIRVGALFNSSDPYLQIGSSGLGGIQSTLGGHVNMVITAHSGVSGSVTGGDLILASGDAYNIGNNNAGNIYIYSGVANGSGISGNLALMSSSGSFGTGVGVIFIANVTTPPSTNPTGGGILYVDSGALKYRGSSGTISTIATA